MSKTYFPLLIEITDSKEQKIINTIDQLPNGISFKVLETNYRGDSNV